MSRWIYSFLTFEAEVTLPDICKELADMDEEWEVVSHAQTIHGMSVLIRKRPTYFIEDFAKQLGSSTNNKDAN